MEDLSLHILDIVENAIAARAKKIEIVIKEEVDEDKLVIEISDNGIGMDQEVREKAIDPFFTTRSTRKVGLGLSLMARAAQEAAGALRIESELGKGTKVTATFQHSHIDRKPMGSMIETMMTLLLGNPELDISYTHSKKEKTYTFSSQALKDQLRNGALAGPEVIQWLKRNLKEGLAGIGVQG